MADAGDVALLVPSLLRQFTGGAAELALAVEGPATVAELLDTVGAAHPIFNRRVRDETGALRRYVNIYVAGEDVRRRDGLATVVLPGQEVMVIQSVAGG
ncbi:MoaD/ThiS family protein [Arthrobacter sp. 35W]|uniref:MoaD/ThiS family protein n=1 Tax=Arthrobacter sp. 35W TaxID=1132441 RepID=UPI00040A7B35|nr:MoaD/ThiS family protein [Arthrobacter sp. 35W]